MEQSSRWCGVCFVTEILQGQNWQLLERLPVFIGLWLIYVSTASDQPKGLPEGLIFQGCCCWWWWWYLEDVARSHCQFCFPQGCCSGVAIAFDSFDGLNRKRFLLELFLQLQMSCVFIFNVGKRNKTAENEKISYLKQIARQRSGRPCTNFPPVQFDHCTKFVCCFWYCVCSHGKWERNKMRNRTFSSFLCCSYMPST